MTIEQLEKLKQALGYRNRKVVDEVYNYMLESKEDINIEQFLNNREINYLNNNINKNPSPEVLRNIQFGLKKFLVYLNSNKQEEVSITILDLPDTTFEKLFMLNINSIEDLIRFGEKNLYNELFNSKSSFRQIVYKLYSLGYKFNDEGIYTLLALEEVSNKEHNYKDMINELQSEIINENDNKKCWI